MHGEHGVGTPGLDRNMAGGSVLYARPPNQRLREVLRAAACPVRHIAAADAETGLSRKRAGLPGETYSMAFVLLA